MTTFVMTILGAWGFAFLGWISYAAYEDHKIRQNEKKWQRKQDLKERMGA